MPEYTLLGRCARARAWLADAWDPAAAAAPCPRLDPAALAGAVALDRVVRFPAAAAPQATTGSPTEDSYLPPDEADGTGLGPILVDYTVMGVPVEAPPLRRAWVATAGGGAAPAADQVVETPAALDALVETDDGAYDEDDEVVAMLFVCDVQRDLMHIADGLVPIQQVLRGVMHRRTGEVLSVMTVAAPSGLPLVRLLRMEYFVPSVNGDGTHFKTTSGIRADGSLMLLDRVSAVMQPSIPRPTLVLPPDDGVTALAKMLRASQGAFGLAYAPCMPAGTTIAAPATVPGRGPDGLPQVLPLVLHCTLASAATTARMRSRAVALLLPPSGPPRLLGDGTTPTVDATAAAAANPRVEESATADAPAAAGAEPQVGSRRTRRPRLDLADVASESARRRIVRNRVSAARSNAVRRRERLEARVRKQAEAACSAAGGRQEQAVAAAPPLPVLPPRP